MDGNLEIIGREDRQVKINGIRVELEEIENHLMTHPQLSAAVVIHQLDADGNELLAAFVSPDAQAGEITAKDIQDYFTDSIPGYMIPSRILFVDEFPRKPNDKVDYDQLINLMAREELSYIAPRNPVEESLLKIWQGILKAETIGVKNTFFELGGNSLNVMTLIYKIHQEFDVRITIGDIFQNPTIEALANIIIDATQEEFIAIEPVEYHEHYPVSAAQKRIFILQQMDPANISYNMPQMVVLEGPLEIAKLEATFKQLIQRHESLRTSFPMIQGNPVQKIHETVDFSIQVFNASDLPESKDTGDESSNQAGASALLATQFIQPFDLTRAPLLRVGLLEMAENQHLLMFDIHHIITDRTSHIIFIKEFMALYANQTLKPLRVQYKDFSFWENSDSDRNG
jgi:acyl carrier protein